MGKHNRIPRRIRQVLWAVEQLSESWSINNAEGQSIDMTGMPLCHLITIRQSSEGNFCRFLYLLPESHEFNSRIGTMIHKRLDEHRSNRAALAVSVHRAPNDDSAGAMQIEDDPGDNALLVVFVDKYDEQCFVAPILVSSEKRLVSGDWQLVHSQRHPPEVDRILCHVRDYFSSQT